jgi:hypothetical protein
MVVVEWWSSGDSGNNEGDASYTVVVVEFVEWDCEWIVCKIFYRFSLVENVYQ